MKLTEKQKMILFQTLTDSLRLRDTANCFTYDTEQRQELANQIINQQDEPMKGEEIQKNTPHPWGEFLKARMKAILWMKYKMEKCDNEIALDLSMDETQVRLIREDAEKICEING